MYCQLKTFPESLHTLHGWLLLIYHVQRYFTILNYKYCLIISAAGFSDAEQ
jgi:hypothetical protein